MLQVQKRAERECTGNTVGGQAHVQLETTQRIFRMDTKNAVGNTARKAQRGKSFLERTYISTVEERDAQEQVAVAQFERRVNQFGPNGVVHLSARFDAAITAQRQNSVFRFGTKGARYLVFSQVASLYEPVLHIFNCSAGIVFLNRIHMLHYLSRSTNQSAIDAKRSRIFDSGRIFARRS